MKRINPYKKYNGSFIPEWLLPRGEISAGAKLCFARLARFAGENGKAYPKIKTLADALGVSKRQCSSYLKELKKVKLIESEQQGLGQPNVYYFLEHDWQECHLNDSDRMKDASSQGGSIVHDKDEENYTTGVKDTSSPINKESHKNDSHNKDTNKGFSERLQNAEDKQALLDIWLSYRKKKGKHATNYEKDLILNQDWEDKSIDRIREAISYTVKNGWLSLQWPEQQQNSSPFRPDAIHL